MNNVALMVAMGGALATSMYFLSEFHQDQADIHVQSFMAGMETSAQSTSPLDNGSQCGQIDDGFVQFLPSGTQWSITLNEPSCRQAELQVELPKDVNPWQLLERAPNAKVIGQTVTWPLPLDYQSKLNTPYITTLEGGQTDHNSGCTWFKCGGTSTGLDLYPPTPSFTYAKDDQELHTGNLMSQPTNITNDNSLELGGYCEGTGSTVTIYNDSSALATVRCQCPQPEAKIDKKTNTSTPSESDAITENENRCTWTYPASITHNNTYLFNIKESDWVNNTSQATANFEVIGDLYADPLNLTLANDSGHSSTDNITNNTQITISNLEPGSTWEYRRKGDNNWHQGNGNSFNLTANIVYPIGTIETRHTDAAGNSRISNYAGIVITDTKAPVFTSSITNSIDKNTLSSTAVVYQATATDQNNVRYKLSGNDAPLFVIDVNNGNVSLNDTSQNTYRFIVTAEDAAGNTAAQPVTLYINSAPTWQHTGYANCNRSIGRKDAIYNCQQGWSNGTQLPCSGPKPTSNASCPRDGGWGTWSGWGACSKACDGGQETRARSCNSPSPANGGLGCAGASSETRSCNNTPCLVPVDGGWGPWQLSTGCSKACGGGVKTYTRSCNNPSPVDGGKHCVGSNTKTEPCNTQECCKELPHHNNYTTYLSPPNINNSIGHLTTTLDGRVVGKERVRLPLPPSVLSIFDDDKYKYKMGTGIDWGRPAQVGLYLKIGIIQCHKPYYCEDCNIINNVHTEKQCVDAGGYPTSIGQSQKVCKLYRSSCPSGWRQYGNWSATESGSCYANHSPLCGGGGDSCRTGAHAFANTPLESCDYYKHWSKWTKCRIDNHTCTATIKEIGCY